MKKDEINIDDFLKKEGLCYHTNLQPYAYERYKAVNPKLTKEMYEYLRGNGSEWKILCGLKVVRPWSNDVLEPVYYLNFGELYKDGEIYKHRFLPDYYLALTSW